MHLADGGGGDGLVVEAREQAIDGRAELGSISVRISSGDERGAAA